MKMPEVTILDYLVRVSSNLRIQDFTSTNLGGKVLSLSNDEAKYLEEEHQLYEIAF